jgi:transcriptional regulator with XRE-family HTH domain/predicted DNA-binding protein
VNADLAGRLHHVDPAVLGERIRNLRLARGLTQDGLADGAVTVSYISRIEAGQRRPDAALLERFARVLDTTPEHLITGIEPARADEITFALLNAELALETGSADEALSALAGVTAEPDLPDDIRQRADLLTARALESSGRYDEAIIALEGILESQAPRHPLLRARIALSRCYRETGDFTRAIEVGEHGLSALEGLGIDGGDEAIQLAVTIAAAYCERGDLGHAIRLALRTVERADAMGSPRARAAAYWQASIFESERGNTVASIPLAEQALALLKDGEDRRNFARLRAEVGIMMLRADPPQVDTAEDYLAAAREELVASSASVVDLAHCDLGLARARLLAGDTEAAAELGLTTLTSTRDIAPAVAAEAASLLGQVAMSTGTKDRASEHYREAVALLTGVGQDRRAAQLWLDLGTHLEILGDADAARDAYRRAAVASGLQMPLGLRANV